MSSLVFACLYSSRSEPGVHATVVSLMSAGKSRADPTRTSVRHGQDDRHLADCESPALGALQCLERRKALPSSRRRCHGGAMKRTIQSIPFPHNSLFIIGILTFRQDAQARTRSLGQEARGHQGTTCRVRPTHRPDLLPRQHLPYPSLTSLDLCRTRAKATEPTAHLWTRRDGQDTLGCSVSARSVRRGELRERV